MMSSGWIFLLIDQFDNGVANDAVRAAREKLRVSTSRAIFSR
jgi:hypothetical protein